VSGIDGIGGTPVVRLEQLVGEDSAEVWVKLEGANPTGSYKDRMALAMVEAAERDGRLQPGQTVVEYTGGSTGSSLAYVCALRSHPLRIVSSDAFAVEKIATMRAFGADVELISSPQGITPELIPAMVARAGDIAAETGAFWTDQFNNTDMIDGYRRLGEELLEQLPDTPAIETFCSYIGTAAASSARRGPCTPSFRSCSGSQSSQPSRRSSPAGPRGRTTSKAAGSAVGHPCSSRTTSTR